MKAFSKVMLAPGESATVTFDLDATAFRRWDAGAHAWVVDGGEYEVAIGASSADIRGVASVTLTGATPSS
jgi:beta-glucosidase